MLGHYVQMEMGGGGVFWNEGWRRGLGDGGGDDVATRFDTDLNLYGKSRPEGIVFRWHAETASFCRSKRPLINMIIRSQDLASMAAQFLPTNCMCVSLYIV